MARRRRAILLLLPFLAQFSCMEIVEPPASVQGAISPETPDWQTRMLADNYRSIALARAMRGDSSAMRRAPWLFQPVTLSENGDCSNLPTEDQNNGYINPGPTIGFLENFADLLASAAFCNVWSSGSLTGELDLTTWNQTVLPTATNTSAGAGVWQNGLQTLFVIAGPVFLPDSTCDAYAMGWSRLRVSNSITTGRNEVYTFRNSDPCNPGCEEPEIRGLDDSIAYVPAAPLADCEEGGGSGTGGGGSGGGSSGYYIVVTYCWGYDVFESGWYLYSVVQGCTQYSYFVNYE